MSSKLYQVRRSSSRRKQTEPASVTPARRSTRLSMMQSSQLPEGDKNLVHSDKPDVETDPEITIKPVSVKSGSHKATQPVTTEPPKPARAKEKTVTELKLTIGSEAVVEPSPANRHQRQQQQSVKRSVQRAPVLLSSDEEVEEYSSRLRRRSMRRSPSRDTVTVLKTSEAVPLAKTTGATVAAPAMTTTFKAGYKLSVQDGSVSIQKVERVLFSSDEDDTRAAASARATEPIEKSKEPAVIQEPLSSDKLNDKEIVAEPAEKTSQTSLPGVESPSSANPTGEEVDAEPFKKTSQLPVPPADGPVVNVAKGTSDRYPVWLQLSGAEFLLALLITALLFVTYWCWNSDDC